MKYIHSKIIISIIVLTVLLVGQPVFAQNVFPTAGAVNTPAQNMTIGTDQDAANNDPRDLPNNVVPNQNAFPTAGATNVPAQNTTAVPSTGTQSQDRYLIKNPFGDKTTTLSQVILNVVSIVRILLIMMAVLYLIYAGFMFVTARGEPGKIKKARNALLWGFVGIALILAAQVIVTTLQNTVSGVLQ